MEYIQSKKVIHGDLKPSNVLFRSATSESPPTASPPLSVHGRHAFAAGAHVSSVDADCETVTDVSLADWPYVVKVSDFGLSVKVDESGHVSNAHHGTPGYMAPEVRTINALVL